MNFGWQPSLALNTGLLKPLQASDTHRFCVCQYLTYTCILKFCFFFNFLERKVSFEKYVCKRVVLFLLARYVPNVARRSIMRSV